MADSSVLQIIATPTNQNNLDLPVLDENFIGTWFWH